MSRLFADWVAAAAFVVAMFTVALGTNPAGVCLAFVLWFAAGLWLCRRWMQVDAEETQQ